MSDPVAHRRGRTTVSVIDASGAPLVGREVQVEQVRHEFAFGCIAFDLIEHANGRAPQDAQLADDWLALFGLGVLPFYWGDFEPEPGHPRTEALRTTAGWLRDRGVRVKGHPLVWHTVKAAWLDALPTDEVERRVLGRVQREVTDFAGFVDEWDVINEVVIMPIFTNEPDGVPNAVSRLSRERGRVELVRAVFDEARRADPGVRLLINDFDLSADYVRLIDEVLQAGVELDAIGIQTHMHQGFRGAELVSIADRFSQFGLPLHFTETTIVSGDLMPRDIVDLNDFAPETWPSTPEGERRQARDIEAHYRLLVAHRAVESITYWGITDRGAWLGAPVGLLRTDGTRKPSYDALHALLREDWWMPATTLVTNSDGEVVVEGFAGDYALRVGSELVPIVVERGETRLQTTITN